MKIEWIKNKDLKLDTRRMSHLRLVEHIVQKFDPECFGIITVARTENGLQVVDGRHRVEAIRKLFGENEKVPCVYLEGENDNNPKARL